MRGPDEWTVDNPATLEEIEAEAEQFRGGEISISSYGGAYQAAQRAAWFEPFTQQFGVGFIEFTNSSNDLIKAQAETGNLLWDTVTTDFGGITLMCDQGLLEELDFSIIDNRHLIDVAINPCGSGPGDIAAHVLTYSLETYPDGSVQPTSWEDFFDVDRFPGRRFIRSDWTLNLWGALFADDPSILDTEESRAAAGSLTPAEVDRAFEIWEGFRDNLAGFWQSGSQCPQMLISGEADMCTAPNGRITDAQKKGAPLKICWECGFAYDAAGFAIPKGLAAQDPDQFYLTQLWMAWASFPENMIRFADYITYPPITALAPMLLADPRFDAVRDAMPLSAENIIYGVGADPAWVGEAYEEIQERWRTLQLSGG